MSTVPNGNDVVTHNRPPRSIIVIGSDASPAAAQLGNSPNDGSCSPPLVCQNSLLSTVTNAGVVYGVKVVTVFGVATVSVVARTDLKCVLNLVAENKARLHLLSLSFLPLKAKGLDPLS